ncbi:MAG: glycoside hydrolase family 95 protein, partial [Armatimonadota bacterium]
MKCLGLLVGLLVSGFAMANDSSTKIWATAPAKKFYDSTPLGNGRIGAMVFGGVTEDRIVLNESTVWSGSPQDADREDAVDVLPEIRRLLLSNQPGKAQELLQQNFVCKGPGSSQGKNGQFGCYQVLGNLRVKYDHETSQDYSRTLDLETAKCTISYISGGTPFERVAFVSAPDKVFVYRVLSKGTKKINAVISLDRGENASTRVDNDRIVIEGQLPSGAPGIPGLRYQGQTKVVIKGGTQTPKGNGIEVKNAEEMLILVSAGTSMFDPDFAPVCTKQLSAATKLSFADLSKRHVKDYQKFFNRVELTLPVSKNNGLATIERMAELAKGTSDPALCALYFNFGRYLLISSSRPDSPLPANLQGLWAEEIQTPWNADFHLNINVQMNYWLAENCNLSDCANPLLDFVPKLVDNGRKTARAYYGARGWVAHTITNP